MSPPLTTALQATGNIKVFQIVICIIMLCELPFSYFILYTGGKPYMVMYPSIFLFFLVSEDGKSMTFKKNKPIL